MDGGSTLDRRPESGCIDGGRGMPPPTVQPVRVVEMLVEPKKGVPVSGFVPEPEMSVWKPPKAAPPVA